MIYKRIPDEKTLRNCNPETKRRFGIELKIRKWGTTENSKDEKVVWYSPETRWWIGKVRNRIADGKAIWNRITEMKRWFRKRFQTIPDCLEENCGDENRFGKEFQKAGS